MERGCRRGGRRAGAVDPRPPRGAVRGRGLRLRGCRAARRLGLARLAARRLGRPVRRAGAPRVGDERPAASRHAGGCTRDHGPGRGRPARPPRRPLSGRASAGRRPSATARRSRPRLVGRQRARRAPRDRRGPAAQAGAGPSHLRRRGLPHRRHAGAARPARPLPERHHLRAATRRCDVPGRVAGGVGRPARRPHRRGGAGRYVARRGGRQPVADGPQGAPRARIRRRGAARAAVADLPAPARPGDARADDPARSVAPPHAGLRHARRAAWAAGLDRHAAPHAGRRRDAAGGGPRRRAGALRPGLVCGPRRLVARGSRRRGGRGRRVALGPGVGAPGGAVRGLRHRAGQRPRTRVARGAAQDGGGARRVGRRHRRRCAPAR